MGYPLHAWLAVGELSEAEAELLADFPNEAKLIREERIKYVDNLKFQINEDHQIELISAAQIDTLEILRRLTILAVGLEIPPKRKRTTRTIRRS